MLSFAALKPQNEAVNQLRVSKTITYGVENESGAAFAFAYPRDYYSLINLL
jgi:hypothetical protein